MPTIKKNTLKNGHHSYEIRIFDPASGKQKSKTFKPSSGLTARQEENAVNAAAAEFEKEVQQGTAVPASITLNAFIDQWLRDYASQQLRPNTLAGYQTELPQIRAALGHLRLDKIQPVHITRFLKNLSENNMRRDCTYQALPAISSAVKQSGKSQRQLAEDCGLSPAVLNRAVHGTHNVSYDTASTVCGVLGLSLGKAYRKQGKAKLSGNTLLHYYHTLQTIFSTAVEWQIIVENPCSRVKPPRKETPPQAVLSVKDAQRLITCLDGESVLHRAAVLLLLYSGARRSEVYGLEWPDVDLDRLQITINKTYQRVKGTWCYQPCKNESSRRVVALPDCCRILFTELRASQAENELKCGSLWQNSPGLLLKEDGGHASPDELDTWFKAFCRRNGFPESIHIHSLRHTNATLQIAAHQDVRSVSARLGHSQTSTTLNIYAHAIQSADAKAADILGQLLPLDATQKKA